MSETFCVRAISLIVFMKNWIYIEISSTFITFSFFRWRLYREFSLSFNSTEIYS